MTNKINYLRLLVKSKKAEIQEDYNNSDYTSLVLFLKHYMQYYSSELVLEENDILKFINSRKYQQYLKATKPQRSIISKVILVLRRFFK